jgi:hypothetical protein
MIRDSRADGPKLQPLSYSVLSRHESEPEPAYQALQTTPLDYIEIRSPEDAIRQISQLKENPELYRRMAENARMRARQFTIDRIAAQWCEVLAGPVAEGFSSWSEQPVLWKSLVRPIPLRRPSSATDS